MTKSNFKKLIADLHAHELATLEDEIYLRLDEIDFDLVSYQQQIDDIWNEHGVYDPETGDHNLHGNAFHYEERLQDELGRLEEEMVSLRDQLTDIERKMECLKSTK